MEVSKIFSFFGILKESIKLLPRNGMLFASILTLSLILPSILLLSFIRFYESLTTSFIRSDSGSDDISQNMLSYLALLLFVEIFFLVIFYAISHISGIATILVSSASYTGNSLSPKQLFSGIKKTWRKPLSAGFRFTGHSSTRYLPVLIFLGVLLVIMYPNAFTISGAVVIGTVVIGFQLYSSVVLVLSLVIIVLDDSTFPGEAVEKAGSIVKGNHMKGFALNLFVNFVCLMVLGLAWVLSDEGWSLNLALYGLIVLSVVSIMKMVVLVAYTVLYYQCKKERGEAIEVVAANVEYAKLPSTINHV